MGVRWRMAAAHEMQGTAGSWGRHIGASQEGIGSPGRRSLRQGLAELVADHLRTSHGRKSPSRALAGVRRPGQRSPSWSEVTEPSPGRSSPSPDRSSTRPGQRSPSWALPKLVADRPPPCPALAGGRRAGSWQDTGVHWRTRPTREMQDTAREMGGRWQDRGHRCVRRQLRRQAAGPRPSMRAAALRLVGIGDKIGGSRNRRCNL
jgi:hypothetical protein